MIELGLARISKLLKHTPIPWRAIHVAGTNGKGSVCAYASAMLAAGRIACGRFTSPHLIDKWDCITINEKVVDQKLFHHVENIVKSRNHTQSIKASEFEILTATAFEIFTLEKIEVGVVEVGLGGRFDATNILPDPFVTVITKIGEDHQSFLGNSLDEIAYQKAGIMKRDVPCIADGSNLPIVNNVLTRTAETAQAASLTFVPQDTSPQGNLGDHQVWKHLHKDNYEEHQQMHIYMAYEAVRIAATRLRPDLSVESLVDAIPHVLWPGRLQRLDISSVIGQKRQVLLDGAHNAQSAEVLGSYVDRELRIDGHPVTWVIAISHGKNLEELLSYLLRPGDRIIAGEFETVDGMPWVYPAKKQDILDASVALGRTKTAVEGFGKVKDFVQQAAGIAEGGPLVIAGSLYLVSDVLRMLRGEEKPT